MWQYRICCGSVWTRATSGLIQISYVVVSTHNGFNADIVYFVTYIWYVDHIDGRFTIIFIAWILGEFLSIKICIISLED